ncbi:MAG: DUF1887 family CARF protein, partial [Bacillota bacterium]|nr:DUF1887 family CARF protein [Bacillota bacterium]
MTIIEYYSAAAIENAVTSLSFKPDKMILIYDNTLPRGQIETDAQRIYNLLYSHSRNFKKIIPVPVNIRAVRETAEVLYNLAEEYKDCTFDLTGGDRLVMVSMGIAYERLRSHNVQMIRYDIVNGAITDYDGDGNIPLLIRPEYISVPESISLYGGQCRWTRVEYTKAFSDNLMELWEINRKNPTKWNNNTSLVSRMRSKSRNESNNPLVITEDYNFSLSKFSAQERGELDSFVKELIRENILVRDQKNGKEIW